MVTVGVLFTFKGYSQDYNIKRDKDPIVKVFLRETSRKLSDREETLAKMACRLESANKKSSANKLAQ